MNELAKAISELVNTINGGANGLGQALKTNAPQLWKMAVYQAKVDAWSSVAMWCSLAVILLLIGRHFRTHVKYWETERAKLTDDPWEAAKAKDSADCWRTAFVIAMTLASIIVVATVGNNMPQIMNPEYAAASALSERFLGK